jgi:hypothetical protein
MITISGDFDQEQGDQIGRIFALGAVFNSGLFFQLQKYIEDILAILPWCKLCNYFDKNWTWLHIGHFFTNSSGHPDQEPILRS